MIHTPQPFIYSALSFLCITGCSALTLSTAPEKNVDEYKTKGRPRQPHILFAMADDLGWHDLGYMGSNIDTPNINKLAAKSIKLTNYYVHPTCSPTRASLMTGLSPVEHQIVLPRLNGQKFNLPESKQTLPELLKKNGYETHLVGKWHLGFWKEEHTPTFKGFNSFYGFYGEGENYWSHDCKSYNGRELGYDFRRDDSPNCGKHCSIVEESARGQHGITLFTERAKKIVNEHDVKKPLFLYFAWQAVHAPFVDGIMCNGNAGHKLNESDQHTYNGKRISDFACVLMMADKSLGEVVDALTAKNMIQDTVIIFSSDNGGPISTGEHMEDDVGSSNWPLRGGKHTLFEGGIRSPAFIRTGWAEHSTKYNGLMSVEDWLPTLASLANIHTTPATSAKDQWSALVSGGASPRDHVISTTHHEKRLNLAIRSDKWKLIKGSPGMKSLGWSGPDGSDLKNGAGIIEFPEHLLYDLEADPAETKDVSGEHPDVLQKLLNIADQYDISAFEGALDLPESDIGHTVQANIGDVWGPWQ